jgi:hypothetical protein
MAKTMTQQTTPTYPTTASILALVSGILITLSGVLLVAVSFVVLPHLDYSYLTAPQAIAALSERGIVHVEARGNTNEVSLVTWSRL